MAENHIKCANCGSGLTPHFVNRPGVWIHMYTGLINCGRGLKTAAELTWHNITDVLQAYERHELRESELILVLGTWKYVREDPITQWDDLIADTPGSFSEVVRAHRTGRIPDHIYDAILELASDE
jgi:hypothetical protein